MSTIGGVENAACFSYPPEIPFAVISCDARWNTVLGRAPAQFSGCCCWRMMKMKNRIATFSMITFLATGLASPALAVDGVLEINQASADNTG